MRQVGRSLDGKPLTLLPLEPRGCRYVEVVRPARMGFTSYQIP
jgi:hypothetical protein